MEFQKICKEYLNRYINSAELLNRLKELNLSGLSEANMTSLNALVISIESIVNETSDETDELVKTEIRKNKENISTIETIVKKNKEVPQDLLDYLARQKEELEKPRDNFERWGMICDAITQNKYYQESFAALTDADLLSLIAQDIKAPRPIQIDAEKFNRLVDAGIAGDQRESLWRLALNYAEQDFDFQRIVDFYFEKNDLWYLTELISAIGEKLNIQNILDRLEELEAIKHFIESRTVLNNYVTPEQFEALEKKLNTSEKK